MSDDVVKEIKTVLDTYPRISLFSDINRLKLAKLIHQSLNEKKLLGGIGDMKQTVKNDISKKSIPKPIKENSENAKKLSELAPKSEMINTVPEVKTHNPKPKKRSVGKKVQGHVKPAIRDDRVPRSPVKSDRKSNPKKNPNRSKRKLKK